MTEATAWTNVPARALYPDRPTRQARPARPAERTRARSQRRSAARWFLLAALPTVAMHALALGAAGRGAATVGEASTAAAAFAQARLDGSQFSVPWVDGLSVHQLAALDVLVGELRGGSVLDGARAVSLAASLLTCLLLWAASRRLGFRPPAAAAAVALAGVPAAVVSLHGAVDAGVLAALWLALAAAVPGGNLALRLVALLAGVLTVPLAAVGLLAFAAHLVVTGVVFPSWRSLPRLLVTVLLVDCAVLVAVLATGDRPLAVLGDAAVAASTVLIVVILGLTMSALVWWRRRWLRPVVAGAVALLACAAVPGPAAGTALLLALPVLAVLTASLLDREPGAAPRRQVVAATAAASLVALAAAVPLLAAGQQGGAAGQPGALADWITNELDTDAVVAVDDLTWAQLVRDGVPAQHLVATGGPLATAVAGPDALLAPADRPGRHQGWRPTDSSVRLAVMQSGPGDAPIEIRRRVADPVAARAAAAADRADRARFGSTMAGNSALELSAAADQQLRSGEVDARLMTVLATFAVTHRITIEGFLSAQLDSVGLPRRTVRITALDGRAVTEPGAADLARFWLTAQLAPYRPLSVQLVDGALLIRYSAPAPIGLLAR